MAAASAPDSGNDLIRSTAIKTEPDDPDFPADLGPVVKRDPVVTLMAPVTGLQPLSWSQDHRLATSTCTSVSMIELVCDVLTNKQEMTLHRTFIPVPAETLRLKVGPAEELASARQKFEYHPDPCVRQMFMADVVMNPTPCSPKGVKCTSWSPLGCDASGRCLLACLTLDHRLTVHNSVKRLEWNVLVDLSQRYSDRLAERSFSKKDDEPPKKDLLDFGELKRRFQMQTPLLMEWSSVYAVKQLDASNECREDEIVFLAVLMENGDLVLWKFPVPCLNEEDVVFYDVIESGVAQPSGLAWWEYDNADRRMSGLIVGSAVGPVTIMPVNLTGVRGYFTLRQSVVLWQEVDEIAVENINCVPIYHPLIKAKCSLVIATRGCYVFWCLLMISPAGLNVHNSHVAGIHSLPIVSMAVSRRGVVVYTCSMDGTVKKLTPRFTETTMVLKQEGMLLPDNFPGRRVHSIAVSCNGAYVAVASTQGMVSGLHPVDRNYQIDFLTLKTPETAGALLLNSPSQNLYRLADLADLVRWKVLKDKAIPQSLIEELDAKIRERNSPYHWRIKLFLLRVLRQSLQKPPADPRWKPTHEDTKIFIGDDEEDDEDEDDEENGHGDGVKEEDGDQRRDVKVENEEEEKLVAVQSDIDCAETHLNREHMKKVLSDVYLNIRTAVNTRVPTSGLVEYLGLDPQDNDSEVLIGHVMKKMNKQTFHERCSLCQQVLPFTDPKEAMCAQGHSWLRCGLSYEACQTLTFRRCLLLDTVGGQPDAADPEWIKAILHGPCTFCDSPLI